MVDEGEEWVTMWHTSTERKESWWEKYLVWRVHYKILWGGLIQQFKQLCTVQDMLSSCTLDFALFY
jgi:hypothetical protein